MHTENMRKPGRHWLALAVIGLSLLLGVPATVEAQPHCTTVCEDGRFYEAIWYCIPGQFVDCNECWVECGPDGQ